MITREEFRDQVMDGIFDDIFLYHNGPYTIGGNSVEFLYHHMKCSGSSINDTYFTYNKDNILPAMLFLDSLAD